MKKHLLLFLAAVLSISAFAADATPNPYAYDLKVTSYDEENFKVTLQYSLNAPASSVKIYAKDGAGNSYLLKEFGSRSATTYNVEIDLLDAMENKNVPPGEDLSWYVDVACASRGAQTKAVTCGRKINFRSPFSIDIDNNPNSPYFGRIVTTQANSNETRGLRAYKPNFTQIGSNYIGSIVRFPSGNWYNDTHLTPFRIRVLQDGTGRVFVSSADVGQSTYMWKVDPANLNNWTEFLTSDHMIDLLGHPDKRDNMGNLNFDFRKNPNGTWDMLLLSASLDDGTNNCSAGYSHSGIYHLDSDLNTQSYTRYTTNIQGSPDVNVDDNFVAAVINANAQFDRDGGVWYSTFSNADGLRDKSALIHRSTSGQFYDGYATTMTRLQRQNTATGAIRYSKDFSKFAVANGGLADEVTIITMNHDNGLAHPTFSTTTTVNMITATRSNTAYIIDFAWDYASNLYACVRNSDDADLRGVWVMAWNLEGQAVRTPARDVYNFTIPCDPDQTYTVTCTATDGGRIVNGYSGGTQKSCTQMTVKAEPVDNNYKFDKWTDQSGKTVSTNAEYTFRVVKDVQLTAHFSGAVYNVTWWNLFQNEEDIAKESTAYPHTNERLWRLYQVEFKKYNSASNDNKTDLSYNGKKQFDVGGFLYDQSQKNADFLTNQSQPFHWLYNYLNYVNGRTIEATANFTLRGRLQYFPYLFFNRADTAFNSSLSNCNPYCNGVDYYKTEFWKYENGKYDKSKKFKDYGKATYWRPWWTEGVCGLPKTYNYADDMPITWNQNPCASGTVPGMTATKETKPSQWYQWNTADGKLLAWREGGTDPEKNRIVYHVDKDMALYATYVDKHISESKDNDDVIRLMQNSNYASTPHTVTVDRKLQAGMYNTICLPFTVDLESLTSGHPLYNADVRKLTGKTENLYDNSGESVIVLNFEPVTTMEAGKPYIIKLRQGLANVTTPITFTDDAAVPYNSLTTDAINTEVLEFDYPVITFHAVTKPTEVPEGALILVAENRLAIATGGEMKGLRGYFVIDDPYLQEAAEDGRVYMSMNKPTTTSIPVAPEAEQQTKPQVRKIMRDGKIYILRGEEIYTITGHRVK